MARHPRHVLLLAVVLIYLPFFYLYGVKLAGIEHVDFPSFYFAAQLAFDQHTSPYAPDVLARAAGLDQRIYPYLYPPTSLPFFYPLTLFDYETAKRLMLGINHIVLLGWTYFFLCKVLRLELKTTTGMAAAFFFLIYLGSFDAVITNLDHGQVNLIVIAALSVSWYALQRERPHLAAGSLAIAIVLKTYPVLFLPLLLRRGRYRTLAWVGVWLLGFVVLATATLPVEVWRDWAVNVAPTGGYAQTPDGLFSPARAANQSINGFVSRLFLPNEFHFTPFPDPQLARLAAYALAILIVGASLLLIFSAARLPQPARVLDLEFALVLLMMYLVAPLSWFHHLIYVLPAVFVALYRLLPWERSYLWMAVAAGSALLLAWDLPYGYPSLGESLAGTLMISLKFYAVAGLWTYTAWRLHWAIRRARDAQDVEGQQDIGTSTTRTVTAVGSSR